MAQLTLGGKTLQSRVSGTVHPNAILPNVLRGAYAEHSTILESMRGVDKQQQALQKRIGKGRDWLERYPESHPRHDHNQRLLDRLTNDLDELLWQARDLGVARMQRAITIWACYESMSIGEREAILPEIDVNAVERADVTQYNELMTHWSEMGDIVEVPFLRTIPGGVTQAAARDEMTRRR